MGPFFFFSITVYIQYYFVVVSGVQHSGYIITCFTKYSSQYLQYSPGTIPNYYNTTDYIFYTVPYNMGPLSITAPPPFGS